jgi:VWFA-related protein
MRGSSPRTWIFILILIPGRLCLPAFSRDAAEVRIGVALLRSGTDKVSVTEARDRLVKALDRQKVDKKKKIPIQALGLDASQASTALAEAKAKNCRFVLLSHLTHLQTSENSIPGATQGAIDYVPVFTARVEYELRRVIDGAEYAVGSAKAEDSSSLRDAVLQAMGRIAHEVTAALDKGGNVPPAEPAPAESVAAQTPKRFEEVLIAQNFCAWLPTDISHHDALRGVCEYAISLPQKMPNFICEQETSRYRGNNRVPRDLIQALVRYEDGAESYSEIKLNGKPAPSAITESPGLWSSGEFGSNLRAIFNLGNRSIFEFSGENKLGARAAWVFHYKIVRQNDPLWRLHGEGQVLAPPYGGELWVDQKTGELLRFRSLAKEIPPTFSMQGAELLTDYDTVGFGDGTAFLLPVEATVATKYRGEEDTRNVVQFRNCRKFRAKARMVLNVPPGAAGPDSAVDESRRSADLQRPLDENTQLYAILREQAVRDDAARLESESIPELEAATVGALWRLSALERQRQKNLAQEVASVKSLAPSTKEALATLKVSVKLVPVSVVLRDSKGNVAANLRKEDFQLFDNGKPQSITSFSVEKPANGAGKQEPDKTPGAGPGSALAGPGEPASATRYVAYVFDDIHSSLGDLANARDAAAQHVGGLQPGDRAAVLATSGGVALDFTADREKLQQALRDLRPHPALPASTCPPLSQYMADLIVNQDDLDVLGAATRDAINCAFGGISDSGTLRLAERTAKSTAFEVLNASSAENQSTLSVLREAVRRTAATAGSRSIVLVSPGFLTLTPETRQAVAELVDRAVRANIPVNTLDIRGLFNLGLAGNASHPANPVVRLALDRDDALARSDVMAELAYGTGGTFFHNNNDVNEGFRRTSEAPECIYILGFSPQKLDGKFHKLKVKLVGPEKLAIQARQGYYALRSEQAQ